MIEVLSVLAVLVVGGGLLYASARMEPHWVSRDGHRFICKAQLVDHHGRAAGGWNEYRFRITETGEIMARRRSMFGRRGSGQWRVQLRSTNPPRRKAVFLLASSGAGIDVSSGDLLAIRLPERSRAVPVLDALTTH